MNKLFTTAILTFSLALCAYADTESPQKTLTASPHFQNIAKKFAAEFPKMHLKRTPLDDSISMMTWTNYINSLDPDHIYFLASDIAGLEAAKQELDDQLKLGNLAFAYIAFDVYKTRMRNRHDYIQKLLDKEFNLGIEETYTIKRKELPFPADMDEWDDIWRKKIKNEYLRFLVAQELKNNEPGGDDPEEDEEEYRGFKDLPPKERILKQYKNMQTIMEDYDSDWVLQRYLTAFTQSYDPHSTYLSPSSLANFNIDMKLSLEGIGALLQPEDGAAMIVRLIPGGPASRDESKNRLKPGDKIIAVGQGDEPPVDTLHWPLDKVVRLIRGPKGTVVTLTIIPKADPARTKVVRITRDKVKLEDQEAKWVTESVVDSNGKERKLGIISLRAFYANMQSQNVDDPKFKSCAHDVEQLIIQHRSEDVDGLLLDLRANGGGALQEAIDMTGLMITTGPVVQVKDRFRRVLDDENPKMVYSGPLVVLINRLSASATEILASALQDYGRAVIIGDTKTHGKGTVQNIAYLDDNDQMGAMKVTIAGYYRISGESTQLNGVKPDIILPSMFDNKEWGEESLPNALTLPPIRQANYAKLNYLDPVIAKLTANSKKRTDNDPKYQAYCNLLDRINTMYETTAMPLDIETRKTMALEEKNLYEIQETLARQSEPVTTNNNLKADLILQEALNILSDLSAIEEQKTKPTPTEMISREDPKPTLRDRINNWLQNL